MDNIVKRLQYEAGLTEEQAVRSLAIMKDFMDKEGMHIDWQKFFQGKYDEFKDKAKSFYDTFSEKAEKYTEKLSDQVDILTAQAKAKAHDLSNKASDMMKNEE